MSTNLEPPPPWRPRPGWGTVRNYHTIPNDHGGVDIAFRFIPDDGSASTPVALADTEFNPAMLPAIGEFARGIMHGTNLTIKVPPDGIAESEALFREINSLELAKRALMYSERTDLAEDCGWTWTEDFTLQKAAPGITDQ
ncbi:hypothetical protein [Streptacidiphilus jiangxiensis]|uniref:Uncharacterized protein n=1 Tax=Streptacidiphilus jiangxiensis TaxID=235985 RepID=A0A1H7HEC5_STRJI|nr:hypothetical protein [Streptacidiphilus jiangxiensis]SEK47752.1 hypothetical protein SAMN05414137_102152 [Streptacidiphilus jiangxiensis]